MRAVNTCRGLLAAFVACTSTSRAQQTTTPVATGQLEEIMITAQKRTESLQDAPVSAAVVSSETLSTLNASDISDLNRLVPSVNLNGTFNGRVPLGIRGVSSVSNESTVGLSSGVAILIDGVPVPSDSLAGDQLDNDIRDIEVLRGPQATLGGRTAATGVINMVTRQPSDTLIGDLSVTGTTDVEYRVNGFLSGPVAQALDFSISAYDNDRRYPIKNTQLDHWSTQRVYGTTAKLLWKPNEDLDVTLTGHYQVMSGDGFNFVYTHLTPGTTLLAGPGGPFFLSQAALLPGITPGWGNKYYNSPINVTSRYEDRNASLVVDYHLGDLTLGSITAEQYELQSLSQDLFAVSSFFWNELTQGQAPPFYNQQHFAATVQQFSQEFKLYSPVERDFSYLIGLFYSDEKVTSAMTRNFLPAYSNFTVSPTTKTTDAYLRTTWRFSPETSLVASLRYNYDQLSYNDYVQLFTYSFPPPNIAANQFATDSTGFSNVVGDISIQQRFTPSVMAYFTYARGYSPAAYNTSQAISSDPQQAPPKLGLAPSERINDFELGAKGTFLDNTLSASVTVFYTKYNDFQVQNFDVSSAAINPPLILTSAGAETKGAELDALWAASSQTRIGFNAAYVKAIFTDYDNAPCYYPDSIAIMIPQGCVQRVTNGVTNLVWPSLNGRPLPNAPRFKFNVSAEQRVHMALPYDVVLGGSYSYRDSAEMLADQNPRAIMPSVGILNFYLGLVSRSGKISATAFVDNVANKHYATDVEDFWSPPWGHTDTVIMQPARDSYRYGGLRLTVGF